MTKISTIFDSAINDHLWDGHVADDWLHGGKVTHSCFALEAALKQVPGASRMQRRMWKGMQNMGLNTSSATVFDDIQDWPEQQRARALWMTWCAMMAREQKEQNTAKNKTNSAANADMPTNVDKRHLRHLLTMLSDRSASTGGTMELVLIRGLPSSGKTTMACVLALVGYEHHEADHYFERDGVYKFDPTKLPEAHAWCLERAKNSIARGTRCVVANTFTRRWEMQPYMDAAKAAGVPVRVIEARGEWANCHGVPPDAIERMRARWKAGRADIPAHYNPDLRPPQAG